MNYFEQCIQKQIDADRQRCADGGWKFAERTVARHTIGDFIRAVMAVTDEANAAKFYEGYLAYLEARPDREQPAEEVAKSNIGWCFGEGMKPEHRTMWQNVCNAEHPVFGARTPTPEEAFDAGVAAGKELNA
jgi:hypothetical protein